MHEKLQLWLCILQLKSVKPLSNLKLKSLNQVLKRKTVSFVTQGLALKTLYMWNVVQRQPYL